MKISTRGRYGLRALIDIAAHENECVTLKSVARRQGLSEHYLEQLFSVMKKAGFVTSVRGASGGYSLSCKPGDTSVGDILRALEGSLLPVECLGSNESAGCGSANCSSCVTKPVWERIYDSLNDVLDSISLADLVNDYKNASLGVNDNES